jgi:PAS domain S-box-containing protein
MNSNPPELYRNLHRGMDPSQIKEGEWLQIISYLENEINRLQKFSQDASESHSKYQSLFEMSDDAILVIEDYTFVDCNQAVVKMLGYKSREALLNTHPSQLSPEYQPDGKLSYVKAQEMMDLALKNGSNHFEWIHTRANGENFPVEVWLSKVNFNGRIMINTIWRDLTEKKRAEQIIQKSIEEKEILLKEIHHRVKNNLQIITSLLNLQANTVDNENVKSVLYQSKSRIESMSKIHEMLYGSKNFNSINYQEYLNELLGYMIANLKKDDQISMQIDTRNLFLNINTAIPLGLIINEMVTNSIKYAFPDNRKGNIQIHIMPVNNKKLKFLYSDNGIGFDTGITFENAGGLGFQLISSLTEQLNGKIKRDLSKQGTHFEMDFEIL